MYTYVCIYTHTLRETFQSYFVFKLFFLFLRRTVALGRAPEYLVL